MASGTYPIVVHSGRQRRDSRYRCTHVLSLIFLLLALACGGSTVQAGLLDELEKSLMPGKLSQVHKKFENSCNDCHDMFNKDAQSRLCTECHDHENIKNDLLQKTGYHGRAPEVKAGECRNCHPDHEGRETTIVLFDTQTFNHFDTDFPLQGKHARLDCEQCHDEKKKYTEAKSACIHCHKKSDAHEGQLGEQCELCHSSSRWQQMNFDHGITKFTLKGKHLSVGCQQCHLQNNFFNTPDNCISCHKLDDRHKGLWGDKCDKCHNNTRWDQPHFDHDKNTDYKLQYAHRITSCESCHEKNPYKQQTSDKCKDCHKKNDVHEKRYGSKCETCHKTSSWLQSQFDHDKTDFKLKHKHAKTDCQLCHRKAVDYDNKKVRSCIACHRFDDIHKNYLGDNCAQCHSDKNWHEEINFDHNIDTYPLYGAHTTLACEQCHNSPSFQLVSQSCYSCHKEDDSHKRQLGEDCVLCHNPQDWKAWHFDHDERTEFKLRHAHKGIDCLLCHKKPGKQTAELSKGCINCHAHQDIHDGRFGRQCDKCHNEKSFKEIRQ